jgi:4-amino-4-deoxy-L-arabinose transferase-like glycosyltransferase
VLHSIARNRFGVRLSHYRALSLTYLALSIFTSYVLLYRLGEVPAFYIDEGLFLDTAATLASEGVYATRSLYTYYVANISVGAPLIVPLALSFAVFGEGLLQGRLVMVLFSLLALWLAARLAQRLFGPWAGPLAWWLILVHAYPFFPLFGRMVFGEVPALALLFATLLCWYDYLDNRWHKRWQHWSAFALAGIGLGLACATKPQLLLLVPSFGVLALLDWAYYRVLGLRHFLILGALAAATLLWCYWYQFINIGWERYVDETSSMRIQSGSVFNLDLEYWLVRSRLGFNQRTLYLLIILSAVAWHIAAVRARGIDSLKRGALLILCALWVFWNVLLAAYPRYALVGNVLGTILLAGALVEVGPHLLQRVRPQRRRMVIGLAALLLVLPLPKVLSFLQVDPQDGVVEMGAYIRDNVPADARIETLVWGMEVFSGRRMGHMPIATHVALINAHTYADSERRAAEIPYDFRPNRPDYLLIEADNNFVPAYIQAVKRGEATLVVQFERYTLYRLISSPITTP